MAEAKALERSTMRPEAKRFLSLPTRALRQRRRFLWCARSALVWTGMTLWAAGAFGPLVWGADLRWGLVVLVGLAVFGAGKLIEALHGQMIEARCVLINEAMDRRDVARSEAQLAELRLQAQAGPED